MKHILLITALILSLTYQVSAEQPLRVGLALPLSGVGAPYGEAYLNGLKLGLKDAPGLVELKVEDHRYDNSSALSAARKLAQIDKVDLLSIWGYAPSDAVAPIVSSLPPPVLLASLNPIGRQQPGILNLCSPLENVIQPLLGYLREAGVKKLALVAAQIGSLEQSARALQTSLPRGSIDRFAAVLPEQMDFRSLIARFKSSGVSVVGLFLTPAQIKAFVAQARALQLAPKLFGIDTFNDAEIFALFRDQKEGPVFVDAFTDTKFAHEYARQFKDSSHVVEAARGMLHATLLMHVSGEAAPGFTREAVIRALHSFPAGNGPAGAYRIVEDGGFGAYLSVRQVLYRVISGKLEQAGGQR